MRTPRITWVEVRNWTGYVTKDDRVLAIMLMERRRRWSVVVVETPREKTKAGVEAVLNDHAHHNVCEDVKSRRDALKALREFLRTWAQLPPPLKSCECKDILHGT